MKNFSKNFSALEFENSNTMKRSECAEFLIKATDVQTELTGQIMNESFEACCIVKKIHDVCGDSAFAYFDDGKAIVAVFDGVSGEAGADNASSVAAEIILSELRGMKKITEKKIKDALCKAHEKITHGFTTCLVVVVNNDGTYLAASVGDSSLYGIDINGKITLEIERARIVGDGDNEFRFFMFRDIVKSAIGWNSGRFEMQTKKGRLSHGEIFILATDGMTDNFRVEACDSKITDSSGEEDVHEAVKGPDAADACKNLVEVFNNRYDKSERIVDGKWILAPKKDDVTVMAFMFRKDGATR